MSRTADVAGKTIVVTGASSGFGRGVAVRLGAAGANVVLAARRGDVLDDVVSEIETAGGVAVAVPTDVSDPDAVTRLAEAAVERFGRIDVWVNNVGVGAIGLFWDIPVADHARLVEVNLTGLLYGAHAALRQFRAQGAGVLVNVGSIDSEVPLAYQASYAASKAAVLSLGRSLNEELRLVGEHDTISVGTIMPWAVDTPWWTHAANYSGRTARMAAMDDPQLVVDAIVAACTDPREQQPVGAKARTADVSHHLFAGLTERLSAKTADAESKRGAALPPTSGALHEPMAEGTTVDGGIRARMAREDAADGE
ncbi:SDR family NAD(P)-dependent oxidoreductase [Herbiconiux daphne]|uniref:SDR family NAD(P)-dependent oxidoreductase n=1 Tax=Herbiconiux daphne TaxID=2970914 RepID=A0ABT2H5L3_9MICO|nr:SDR family NAD(P)-dependent oxidoreductase [Herbiconiux daphne]MCS5735226.1 SDR family NAD(P)-dependent oxidoreductase [Herbiconiux daphne]